MTQTNSNKGTWRTYNYLDGLVDNIVETIAQDGEGFLWLGTFHGASRYDGKAFTSFTTQEGLAGNRVRAIHPSSDGALWFATFGGISRWDGSHFSNLTTEDGLVHSLVFAICEDRDGVLWFGTLGGVSRYDGKRFVNFTKEDGLPANWISAIAQDLDGNMWFGSGWPGFVEAGVCRYDGHEFVTFTTEDGLVHDVVPTIYCHPNGTLWFGTGGGVSHYDGQRFRNLTTQDGLAGSAVWSIHQDFDGMLWFGTGGGVSCYDGESFINFTTEDGLAGNHVRAIYQESEDVFWFITWGNGICRYDRASLVSVESQDGLPGSHVRSICQDTRGGLWFGSGSYGPARGVLRSDGDVDSSLTALDDFSDTRVSDMVCDANGDMWFATWNGVLRYDGQQIHRYSLETGATPQLKDGLPIRDNSQHANALHLDDDGALWVGGGALYSGGGVYRSQPGEPRRFIRVAEMPEIPILALCRDSQGILWLGTYNHGVYRYDGQVLTQLSTDAGLADPAIHSICESSDGTLWFGTGSLEYTLSCSGVSRYDGERFENLSFRDGLGHHVVEAIHQSRDGTLWFGTGGGGVSMYDGSVWGTLDTRDGLAGNSVYAIFEHPDGSIWLGTDRGVTRYQRNEIRPKVRIVSLTADRTYRDLAEIPPIVVGTRVSIAYDSIDYWTLPQKRQYRVQVRGVGESRRSFTASTHDEVKFDTPGRYTFSVESIDRDLTYSIPATVELEVVADPRDAQIEELESALERRNRELESLNAELRAELADARAMQMSLMPERAPDIEGVEIAGRCVTANTVGGDFFSYLPGRDNREVGLVIADVAGHAMKGAMNAVMTDGILSMAHDDLGELAPARLMSRVNDVLTSRMESDINVTMTIGLLDTGSTGDPPVAPTLTLANAAHHAYPLLIRDGAVTELKARGLPLGMKAGVEYREETFDLQAGDIVVLMTDGIIEARDAEAKMYGDSGRLKRTLTGFTQDMTAEAMVDAVIKDTIEFCNNQRKDDMSVVITKIGRRKAVFFGHVPQMVPDKAARR